ncbi:Gmad2 immunoglobulin-like domain-containing protein [Sporichthya polymorpha]|uniref:Gmad2 immunoglobulin-like domain-containing protein n=1 Tax=Sporichthya polymorpha TaxID=35751 RepID=UPI000371EC3D|nr:Gmad2 immunoglobulin-like domain-containing protein [Sporichthya polymorpha]
MSDYGSRFGRPEPPEDLEAILARALRAEADRVHPVGDGLAKIRARTEARRGVLGWFTSAAARPALAGGTLVVALVAGTAIGLQVTGDDGGRDVNVVERAPDPVAVQPFDGPVITNEQADAERYVPEDPGPPIGAEGGEDPEVTEGVIESPENSAFIAPVTEEQERNRDDSGIPVDDGQSNYVAILAPLSGRSYSSPLTVAGQARVFEASVTVDVSQNGNVLKRAHVQATQGAPELGDWQVTFALDPGNYRIDAYTLSAADGETKLASDSIWITISTPPGAVQPTPTPSPTPSTPATPTPTPGTPTTTPTPPPPGSKIG